jgi:hypothetical protein
LTAGVAPDGVTITVAGPPPPQLVNNQFTAGVLVGVCVGVFVGVGVGVFDVVGVGVGHATVSLQEVQSAKGGKKADDETIESIKFGADVDIT